MPMTSAATPLFHASPIDTDSAEATLGSAAGRSTARSRFQRPMRNTRAISRSRGSICRMPSSVPAYTTGSTITNAISTLSRREGTQISAAITNDATGTERIAASSGDSSSDTSAKRPASIASAMPASAASAKPARMWPSVNSSERQKSAVCTSAHSRASVAAGEASRIGWPTAVASNCHTASQNAAASAGRNPGEIFFIETTCVQIPAGYSLPDGLGSGGGRSPPPPINSRNPRPAARRPRRRGPG